MLRTPTLRHVFLIAFSMLLLSGCMRSFSYSMKTLTVDTPNLMVANKIERPLFLVLDPAKVPNTFKFQPGTGIEHQLDDSQLFIERDVKAAMANYFTKVEVVDPNFAFPSTPHVRALVHVNHLRASRGHADFDWSFAIAVPEQEDFIFSYTGSTQEKTNPWAGEAYLQRLFSSAIRQMLAGFVDKEIPKTIREFDKKAPTPSEDNTQI